MAVYPRWRGKHKVDITGAAHITGLSPLARGTHAIKDFNRARDRFIPAGAGNTSISLKIDARKAVYPRWRGEHLRWLALHIERCGLSPLARGTHFLDPFTTLFIRFIPAGAGNTESDTNESSSDSVYPRWRGEHSFRKRIRNKQDGLSPLARGTHRLFPGFPGNARFIPAGAGNTQFVSLLIRIVSVYPRWRGEHLPMPGTLKRCAGLSPLARGTLSTVP
ncbi:unnamed protein product (plasmid) [Salmonella enterica subsp. enterica serovar Senftenberg]|nr:unnamed protein product [Salmonella enterica subsp. enterica serovar Senftenberg]